MPTTIDLPLPQRETEEPVHPVLQLLTPYNVVLYNDTIHFVHEVIEALLTSVPISNQEARQVTLQAHFQGRAVVITGNKEEAEYYKERLETYRLSIAIEPA